VLGLIEDILKQNMRMDSIFMQNNSSYSITLPQVEDGGKTTLASNPGFMN
jgi:hypothetical protein